MHLRFMTFMALLANTKGLECCLYIGKASEENCAKKCSSATEEILDTGNTNFALNTLFPQGNNSDSIACVRMHLDEYDELLLGCVSVKEACGEVVSGGKSVCKDIGDNSTKVELCCCNDENNCNARENPVTTKSSGNWAETAVTNPRVDGAKKAPSVDENGAGRLGVKECMVLSLTTLVLHSYRHL